MVEKPGLRLHATTKNRCSLLLQLSILFVCLCFPTLALSPAPSMAPVPAAAPSFGESHNNNTHPDDAATTTMKIPEDGRIIVKNFRNAAGIENVCRCASTDDLGEALSSRGDQEVILWGPADDFIFNRAGLILDLRSATERNEAYARIWMQHARGPIQVVESNEEYCYEGGSISSNGCGRFVVRVDVLSPPRFMAYVEAQWLSQAERALAARFKASNNGRALHELRIHALNIRGLAGLNEAILETGKDELRRALQTMTMYLERNPEATVVIHCVQGKDRTGMLTMLLQSMLGMSDGHIVEDYFVSNAMLNRDGSAAVRDVAERGRISRNIFSGTNRQAMVATLAFLRGKYGSVAPGYLDSIGFDAEWTRRLRAVLKTTQRSKL